MSHRASTPSATAPHGEATPPHTCPVWLGFLLANPLRRLFESPTTLVLPLVRPGDHVLELGPALGFFTLPVAEAIGPTGKLVCVDVQQGMLTRLRKRLDKRGLVDRAELRLCTQQDLGLDDQRQRCDLVLAIHVVHETASPAATIAALAGCVKPGGTLLLVEPAGHCSRDVFASETAAAASAGLLRIDHPRAEGRKLLTLWKRPEEPV
jgi:ubiquinone/menaquinone biosynthesis C-methylase UbiE